MRLVWLIILPLVFALIPELGAETTPPEPASAAPTWRLTVVTSSADRSTSVVATLPALAPIQSGFAQVTPLLTLRYSGGRASAYVLFDTYLGETAFEAQVSYDEGPAERQTWRLAEDRRTAFVPGDPLALIERLKTARTFSVTLDPRKKGAVTVTFAPADVERVIKALLSAGVKYTR